MAVAELVPTTNTLVASVWRPGQAPEPIALTEATDADGVVHVELDRHADALTVHDALFGVCGPELTLEMVRDLLEPDPFPELPERDAAGSIHKLSAFSLDVVDPEPGAGTHCGRIAFELVEFLAGDDWLVTCCQHAQTFDATQTREDRAPRRTCADLLHEVEKRWVRGDFETAGDLGTLMLCELTTSYRQARPALVSWLERWELAYYSRREMEWETLIGLRGLVVELRARLNALNVPHEDATDAWFSGVTNAGPAQRADDRIDRTLRWLEAYASMLRGGFELLQARATSEQLELAHKQRDVSDRAQERFENATALFLVPTLIAGLWGENTWVPGEKQAWGFALTVAVMALGAAIALLALKVVRRARAEAGA